MTSRRLSDPGFTLIELILVLILVGILGTIGARMISSQADSERYEETRAKMEMIRAAILGKSPDGKKQESFGYAGDWGSLPAALTNLTTAQAPAWTFNTTYGVGSGWRGPYLQTEVSGTTGFTQDAWGRNLVYAPAAIPPTLTSYGSDGAAGGTVFGKDIVMEFPTTLRLATVSGIVSDGDTRLNAKTVEVRYPVNGTLTAFTTATNASGLFSFANVPFGVRSLRITTAPVLGPRTITVDQNAIEVPPSTLNYSGNLQSVTYEAGSVDAAGAGDKRVRVELTSSYTSSVQLDFITPVWSGGGYLNYVRMNGTRCDLPNLTSGQRIDIYGNLTMAANSSNNTLDLRYSLNSDGTGNIDMSGQRISATMEWVGRTETDSFTVNVP